MNADLILTTQHSVDSRAIAGEQIAQQLLSCNLRPATHNPNHPATAEEWAPVLILACRSGRKSIIDKGRIFHTAKSSLAYGEWTRIFNLQDKSGRPPVSKKTGDNYALIGQEFGDVDEKWPSHLIYFLPGSVDALHILAQLGKQLVLELILDGVVHERLTATKARELRNEYRPDLNKQRPFNLDRWLTAFRRHVGVLQEHATPAGIKTVLTQIQQTIEGLKESRIEQTGKTDIPNQDNLTLNL